MSMAISAFGSVVSRLKALQPPDVTTSIWSDGSIWSASMSASGSSQL